MRAVLGVIGAAALAAPPFAYAEPATPGGADALTQAYEAYLGKDIVDRGVLRIASQGDSYIVTWDFQKAMEMAPSEAPHITIEPFVYTYTPAADGAWALSADKLPAIAFSNGDTSANENGAIAFDGFRLDMSYDEARTDFLVATVEIAGLTAKIRDPKGGHDEILDLAALGSAAEARVRESASGAGVDLDIRHSLKSFTEAVSSATPGEEPSPDSFAFTEESLSSAGSLKGLRAKEIGKLWRDVLSSADDQARAKTALIDVKAALPLWDTFTTQIAVGGLALRGPQVEAKVKALTEMVGIEGLTNASGAKFGLKIDNLAVTSDLAPPWVAQFSPMSLDFEIACAVEGLEQAAEMAIEEALQANGGEMPAEAQSRIEAILAAGHPTATIAPGHLVLPFVDIAFEGKAQLSPASSEGHFVVSVDSLDKTFDVVKSIAEADPQAGAAIAGLALVKGLAKTGENGRLIWAIDVSGDGKATINGAPFPIPD